MVGGGTFNWLLSTLGDSVHISVYPLGLREKQRDEKGIKKRDGEGMRKGKSLELRGPFGRVCTQGGQKLESNLLTGRSSPPQPYHELQ